MEIEYLDGGYQILRLSPEDLKDLPKVGLGVPRPLPPEIMAKIQKSLDKLAARRDGKVAESPEPATQSR